MERLQPEKLHVTFSGGSISEKLVFPRRYTLTHSDRTGELFLTIDNHYNKKQTSGLYTRLMRDEVLAELVLYENSPLFRIYCHVSGGFVIGTAGWRYNIFQKEMMLVLEALRYGDRVLFERYPELDDAPVTVHFKSTDSRYDKIETWGTMVDYC